MDLQMTKNQSHPNILFVFADQLRASSVGYSGQEQVKTPHIDNFARSGSYFQTAVSMMPVCGYWPNLRDIVISAPRKDILM